MNRISRLSLAVGAAVVALAGAAPLAAAEPPPANDSFADAAALAEDSGYQFGTNVGATKELGEPAHAGDAGGASVWYRWTADHSGRTEFSACGETSMVIAVYNGSSVGALTQVAESPFACDGGASFKASAGSEYRIAVDGVGGATGTFELAWFQRPANDDRADAQTITGETGVVSISNIYASVEEGEPEHGGPGGASVWYRWTAPSSGPARFDTCTTGYDTLLAVYEGDGTSALAANDDYCGTSGSMIGFSAEAGKVYLIAVDGYDGDWVQGPLRWERSVVPPATRERPAITGTPEEGRLLTGSNGAWDGTPPFSYSYQWWRCNASATTCYVIPGASSSTYLLGPADIGSRIRFWVRAANEAGWDAMNSAATAAVAPRLHAAPANTAAPVITGTAAVDETLTATAGTWSGYPNPVFTYEWQACSPGGELCITISSGPDELLTLSADEVGSRIRVIVTATNAAGSARAESALTPVVVPQGGGARCVVPNLRGRALAKAKAAIKRSRCKLGRVRTAYSRGMRKGRVISQSPRAGARVGVGTKVNLLVSKGKRR